MTDTVVDFRCPVYPWRLFGRLHASEEGRQVQLAGPLVLLDGQRVLDGEMVFACDDCRKDARPARLRVLHHFGLAGEHLRTSRMPVVPRAGQT